MRGSIVIRTTLAILALSLTLGWTFALFVAASVDRREQERSQIRLQQLLSTVERTAQIACYLKDQSLAAEIAHGLMRNRAVSGVTIASGELILARLGKTSSGPGSAIHSTLIKRPVDSPFEAHDRVGEITLFVDLAAIHAEASNDSRASALALGLQAALVAAGVAAAVYFFSTRPIKAVSNELHRIRFDPSSRLRIPSSNRSDEIGTLVTDVNALIATLADLLTREQQLRIAREMGERKMRLIFEKAETGLFVIDERGVLESWNPAFLRLLRVKPEQTPQTAVTPLQQLLEPHAANLSQLIRQCLATGEPYDVDLELTGEGRSTGWIQVTLNPIGLTTLQGVVNDITERKRGELVAHQLATQDTLTGLLNRRGLEIGLSAAFLLPSPQAVRELAVMQIDLDHFKEVNDTYGHEGGDQVLRHVAQVLQRNARRGDLIGRPGGDEFVVALVGMADPTKAMEIAGSILAGIQQPIELGHHRAKIDGSIGIAFATAEDDSPEAVLRRADGAMYEAKKAGRGQARLAPETPPPRRCALA